MRRTPAKTHGVAEDAADIAEDTGEDAADIAEDTGEDAADVAEDTGEDATADTGEDATDGAEDTGEDATADTGEDATADTGEEPQPTQAQTQAESARARGAPRQPDLPGGAGPGARCGRAGDRALHLALVPRGHAASAERPGHALRDREGGPPPGVRARRGLLRTRRARHPVAGEHLVVPERRARLPRRRLPPGVRGQRPALPALQRERRRRALLAHLVCDGERRRLVRRRQRVHRPAVRAAGDQPQRRRPALRPRRVPLRERGRWGRRERLLRPRAARGHALRDDPAPRRTARRPTRSRPTTPSRTAPTGRPRCGRMASGTCGA